MAVHVYLDDIMAKGFGIYGRTKDVQDNEKGVFIRVRMGSIV